MPPALRLGRCRPAVTANPALPVVVALLAFVCEVHAEVAAFVRRDEAAVALAIVGGVGIDASRGHAPGGLHGRQNGIAPMRNSY